MSTIVDATNAAVASKAGGVAVAVAELTDLVVAEYRAARAQKEG